MKNRVSGLPGEWGQRHLQNCVPCPPDTFLKDPEATTMGENSHSRYFTEDACKMAAEPKELVIVPGARHMDLYDRTGMIPFDKLESFFTENLGK